MSVPPPAPHGTINLAVSQGNIDLAKDKLILNKKTFNKVKDNILYKFIIFTLKQIIKNC